MGGFCQAWWPALSAVHTQIEAITTHLHPTLPCTIPIHVNLKAAALAESEELRSSLDATNALLIKAMAAATEQETAAAEAVAAKQKELDAAQVTLHSKCIMCASQCYVLWGRRVA